MAQMNLDSVLSQIMSMVRDRQRERENQERFGPGTPWYFAGANPIDATALKKRWRDQEMLSQIQGHELEKQRLINTGNVDAQGVRNIGELARQRLMNEGNLAQENVRGTFGVQGEEIRAGAQKYGADQTLAGHKYTADQSLASHKYTADQLLKGHEITSAGHVEAARLGAEGKRPTPSEIYLQSAGQFYDPAIYDSLRKREIGPPPIPGDDITAGTPPPSDGIPSNVTPPATPSPARATLGGGKSMVFGDEGSTTPMAVERAPRVRSIEEFTPWAKKKKKLFEF